MGSVGYIQRVFVPKPGTRGNTAYVCKLGSDRASDRGARVPKANVSEPIIAPAARVRTVRDFMTGAAVRR